jgi:hypothetical protein
MTGKRELTDEWLIRSQGPILQSEENASSVGPKVGFLYVK